MIIETVLKVISNIEIIISIIIFTLIIYFLFIHGSVKYIKFSKKAKKKRGSRIIKKVPYIKETEDEGPGKLYVPDSTYEILKKEKIMHSKD